MRLFLLLRLLSLTTWLETGLFGWRLGMIALQDIYLDLTSFRRLIMYYAGKTLLWMHRILKNALRCLDIYRVDTGKRCRQEKNIKISGLADF
ncbi:hypothetical protein CEXT_804061 [Caerostris extrusa]|uniref:Secreted protein n=1 Tax=Caerostris extrusa TaxID=172846 RepID=A0AAV4Y3V3_CAEEX|nr:hypothetical protein CEXT_804061 [Caerostris extrusa]